MAIWKPSFSLQHSDRTSNPLQPKPKEIWVAQRKAGDSRWNHRGPKYPAPGFRASTHQKHVAVGKVLEARFTVEIKKLELANHGDWCLLFQMHGKNGPEDSQAGQVNISLYRDDELLNYVPNGISWAFVVNGDSRIQTTDSDWHSRRVYKRFDSETMTFFVRALCGGDGVTPMEDGTFAPIGKTLFFSQEPDQAELVEEAYIEGPNYFPFQGYPDAGFQLPTFGTYVSNSLVDSEQCVIYSNIAVRYTDTFTRDPVFDFGDVQGRPSDPM